MTKSIPPGLHDQPEKVWPYLHQEAMDTIMHEPMLGDFINDFVTQHTTLSGALAHMLAEGLAHPPIGPHRIRSIVTESHAADPGIVTAAEHDLLAIVERDAAAPNLLVPFLYFKGFRVLQAYRIAHWLWHKNRKMLALYFQSRIARCYGVDIHPAAQIGRGILMDHAHGIVIGETAVIEDNVSMVHDVTLGGTGKEEGDRHPKIRSGVMIGAGAIILGNIEVGAGARVAAGSVVLQNAPPHVTVAGVPARIIGGAGCDSPAEEMNQMLGDEASAI